MIERAPWYIAGPLLGVLIIGLFWAANRPLGALGGYVDIYTRSRGESAPLGWRAYMFVGIVVGGLVFALAAGAYHPTTAYGGFLGELGTAPRAFALIAAGSLIGWGARTAGGCTSGHGLCGMSLGSPSSIVSTMTFMTTAVVMANVLSRIGGL